MLFCSNPPQPSFASFGPPIPIATKETARLRRDDRSDAGGEILESQAGVNAASVVKNFGVRLLPELFAHLNPMPYEAALQMEKDLAEDLRRAGYAVTGGH
jgi:hypothetical protein